MSTFDSEANFLAAGLAGESSPLGSSKISDEGSVSKVADAPASKEPITSSDRTVSPSCLTISVRTPSSGAKTSITTLSVSISTSKSSRFALSPFFTCHSATVPSDIDSGKAGAFTSIPNSFFCFCFSLETLK